MKRLITLDISPATATHCGESGDLCGQATKLGGCRAFGRKPLAYDDTVNEYHRLPECIAAEQNAAQDKQAEKAQP